ncbi:hypothetical protein SNEBB_008683 [Seison nebaliae]|nr:hypothetical protein SNEBB_008683 [Seison nebaliae]
MQFIVSLSIILFLLFHFPTIHSLPLKQRHDMLVDHFNDFQKKHQELMKQKKGHSIDKRSYIDQSPIFSPEKNEYEKGMSKKNVKDLVGFVPFASVYDAYMKKNFKNQFANL